LTECWSSIWGKKILRGVLAEKLNRMAPYSHRISRTYLTSRFHLQNSTIEIDFGYLQ
jgi:hypothetical protein